MIRWRVASLSVAVCSSLSVPALAVEWTPGATLSVGTVYSDNICLVSDDKEGKAVGTVTPGISLRGQGNRTNVNLRAAAEYNTLGNSSLQCPQGGAGLNVTNRESWVPRLDFTGELEAVENAIYLESTASASQNPINPFVAGGDDNINGVGNTNINYSYGAGVRLDRRHNDQWASLVRYNYNEQRNSVNQALGNSVEDLVTFDVGMIPSVSRFSAGVRGRYSEVTFEGTAIQPEFTNRLSRAELRAAFQWTRQWQFNAFYGQEDNVFLSTSDEIDGEYWDVGARWTPNTRVSVDAGYGERFFGETPRLAINYSHKRHFLRAVYLRDIQLPRDIRSAPNSDPDDPFDPGLEIPGEPLPGAGSPTFLGQSPVLNESFVLNYRFLARRSSLSLTLTDSQQTIAETGGEGDFSAASASVSRTLGPRLTLVSSLSWTNNVGNLGGIVNPGLQQELESYRFGLGLRRSLAQGALLSLQYNYLDQRSGLDFQGPFAGTFEEHRIQLSLRFQFGSR